MAPITTELATLRALTFRISSTPTSQLPQHVPAIAASLANCRTLLSSTQSSGSKASSSEASVAVHKYRTLLSTLLQDRTIQGRWSAIVLIKASIEVGGWETLQKCLPWVRGLLGFLTKPDPPSSKKLCIITLTRIFLLTREYPTLIREITTPSLPAFIQANIQIANSRAPAMLLQTILESFSQLLPRHPTIFRSYLKQLQPLLARLIAPTVSSRLGSEQGQEPKFAITSEVTAAARQLYVQIPCCAPKGASSEDWGKALKGVINSAHRAADRVFRAVLEDWQSTAREASTLNGHTLDDEMQDLENDDLQLPPWSGIYAGSERLTNLLILLKEYLESPTTNSVYLNIGVIMDLVMRMLSLTVPPSGAKSFQNAVRLNNQVSKEERETLWLLLPDVHVAAIEMLLALSIRSQQSTLTLDALIIDQIVWVFGAEKDRAQIRTACYLAIATVLKRSGVTLPKSTIDSLVPLIRVSCEDLLPSELSAGPAKPTPKQAKANGNSQPQTAANADTFLNASISHSDPNAGFAGLKEAAWDLLPVLLTNIRAQYISDSLRARLDRTAILCQHKDAMLASVLNPPPSKKFGKPAASILPLMARSFPADKDVEGVLKPRMPVIRVGVQDVDMEEAAEIEETNDEEEEDDMVAEAEEEQQRLETEDDSFVGRELDTLLESAGRPTTAVKDFAMRDAADVDAAAPNPSTNDQAVPVPEPTQFIDTGKRSIYDTATLSPSKRVRIDQEGPRIVQPILPTPEVDATPTGAPDTSTAAPTSDFTATATASTVPELPEPGEAGPVDTDSDMDDIVPLVLGQDTDDDSE
ncbi:Nn.00g066340.m01.CDS01 [Neocucurbitaria sp. VM-36]